MNPRSKQNPRFVVLGHQPGPRSERSQRFHFDWMFEVENHLRTWATPPMHLNDESAAWETDCDVLVDHRLHYLDYQGDISGDRGTVRQEIKGCYRLLEDTGESFRAVLEWKQEGRLRQATVQFYRSFLSGDEDRRDDRRVSWRLRFSAGRYDTN